MPAAIVERKYAQRGATAILWELKRLHACPLIEAWTINRIILLIPGLHRYKLAVVLECLNLGVSTSPWTHMIMTTSMLTLARWCTRETFRVQTEQETRFDCQSCNTVLRDAFQHRL